MPLTRRMATDILSSNRTFDEVGILWFISMSNVPRLTTTMMILSLFSALLKMMNQSFVAYLTSYRYMLPYGMATVCKNMSTQHSIKFYFPLRAHTCTLTIFTFYFFLKQSLVDVETSLEMNMLFIKIITAKWWLCDSSTSMTARWWFCDLSTSMDENSTKSECAEIRKSNLWRKELNDCN